MSPKDRASLGKRGLTHEEVLQRLVPSVRALRDALARLSPDHRTVVVLRYFADLSVEEIADRTGARTGTVKSRLHYALSALRACSMAWRSASAS